MDSSNRNRLNILYLSVCILFISFFFIRAFFELNKIYKTSLEGRVTRVKKGSKGNVVVTIRQFHSEAMELIFPPYPELMQKIKVGDSLVKSQNTYIIILFGNQRKFKDSIELYHY